MSAPTIQLDELAASYARGGWDVLPLAVRGKQPLTAHGLHDATTDLDQVGKWWRRWPAANIGIRPAAHLIVIDIDPRNGGSLDQLGTLPATWTIRTGSGGWHLWFRVNFPASGRVRDCEGIDVKSRTGYVVAPGSVHPSGERYTVVDSAPVADLPTHLVHRVRKMSYPRPLPGAPVSDVAMSALVRTVAEAPEGRRNGVLFWAACRAHERGGDPVLLDELRAAAAQAGLAHREIEQTLASAARRGGAR